MVAPIRHHDRPPYKTRSSDRVHPSAAGGPYGKYLRMLNSFGSRSSFTVGGRTYAFHSFRALERAGHDVGRLPFSLRILLENLLRLEDGRIVEKAHVKALLDWQPQAAPATEIAF